MSERQLPDALRQAVQEELEPVRPLLPAWLRTLGIAAVVALVAGVAVSVSTIRFDLGDLPMWLGWGASLVELVLGVVLIGLALREAVPGAAVPAGTARLAVVTAVLIHTVVGVATWMHSPGEAFAGQWVSPGVGCLRHDTLVVLPVLAVSLWLVFRALPLRAPTAGLLGGGGAAVVGDAVLHLLCPMSDLRHILLWHTGALLGFMALGWIFGVLWERAHWRRG